MEISEWLGGTLCRAACLNALAKLLIADGQLNAAEEATVETIKLLSEIGQEDLLYRSHWNRSHFSLVQWPIFGLLTLGGYFSQARRV